MSKDRKWLSLREVSEYLGVHINTLYNWIHDGRIRAGRAGRKWLVHIDEINKVLNGEDATND